MRLTDRTVHWRITATLLAASTLPIIQSAMAASTLAAIFTSYSDRPYAALMVRFMAVAPALALVLSSMWIGRLADRIDRRHVLVGGLLLYAACGIWAYLSAALETIVLSRILLGVAVAAIPAVTQALIADYFEGQQRDSIVGWQAGLIALGSAAFPLIGGILASSDWRLMFLVYLISLPLVPLALALPDDSSPKSDAPPAPVSYTRLAHVYAIAFLGTLLLCLMTTQFALHAREIGIGDPAWIGLMLSCSGITAAVVSTIYRQIKSRLNFGAIAAIAFVGMAAGYAVIGVTGTGALIVLGQVLAGIGYGLYLPNGVAWTIMLVEPEGRGRALAALTAFLALGQLLSARVYNVLVTAFGSSGTFLLSSMVSSMIALLIFLVYRWTARDD